MKIKDYMIVWFAIDNDHYLRQFYEDGWELLGGPFYCNTGDNTPIGQAMVKYEGSR